MVGLFPRILVHVSPCCQSARPQITPQDARAPRLLQSLITDYGLASSALPNGMSRGVPCRSFFVVMGHVMRSGLPRLLRERRGAAVNRAS